MLCLRSVPGITVTDMIDDHRDAGAADESRQRPDIEVLGLGHTAAAKSFVEVAVANPAMESMLKGSAHSRLYVADATEKRKRNKYKSFLADDHPGCDLHVAVLEATGAFGRGAHAILHLCNDLVSESHFAETAGHQFTWAANTFQKFWKQRVARAFWHGSYRMHLENIRALHTQPRASATHLDGIFLRESRQMDGIALDDILIFIGYRAEFIDEEEDEAGPTDPNGDQAEEDAPVEEDAPRAPRDPPPSPAHSQ